MELVKKDSIALWKILIRFYSYSLVNVPVLVLHQELEGVSQAVCYHS